MRAGIELQGCRVALQLRAQQAAQDAVCSDETVAVQGREETLCPGLFLAGEQRVQRCQLIRRDIERPEPEAAAGFGTGNRPGGAFRDDGPAPVWRQRLIPEARRGSSAGRSPCGSSVL